MKFIKVIYLWLFCTILVFGSVNKIKDIKIIKGELQLSFVTNFDKKSIKHYTLTNPFRHVFEIKNTLIKSKHINMKWNKSLKITKSKHRTVKIIISNKTPFASIGYRPLFSKNIYSIPLPKINSVLPIDKIDDYRKDTITKSSKRLHRFETIVIDAGHGGKACGAIGGGKQEKRLVLQIAKRVKKELQRRGYPVYMTREKDVTVTLSQRTKMADRKKAVVFISIHANSVPPKKRNRIHGVETYFLQNTRDAKSQRIAAIENKSLLKGTNKLSRKVIIDSVLSGPKIVESNKLAIDIHRNMMKSLHTKYPNVRDGGVRSAPFYVLVGASRPSVLVEVGYISHPRERKRLFTPRYQNLLAKGISRGIDSYMKNRKRDIDF